MTDLRVCTKGVGFAIIASLTASVCLTSGAYAANGDDLNIPAPGGCNDLNLLGGLPAVITGDTTGLDCNGLPVTDIDNAVCPYTVTGAPDVHYVYSPPVDQKISIDMCTQGTLYDTKIYIRDSTGALIACNDDDPDCGTTFRSQLECVALSAGTLYVISVDGYSSLDAGPFEMNIVVDQLLNGDPCPGPCIIQCDPGAVAEGEPCNDTGAPDTTNGGCNSTPIVFSNLVTIDGPPVCGIAWALAGTRDTDWYQFSWLGPDPLPVEWELNAEIPLVAFIIDLGSPTCSGLAIIGDVGESDPCVANIPAAVVLDPAPAGQYCVWAGAGSIDGGIFDSFPCPPPGVPGTDPTNQYQGRLGTGLLPCPADLTGDRTVGFDDLLIILQQWGPCP